MPEVSLHTAVKGQFGLGTGRAMGKALRVFILKMFLGRVYRQKKRKVLLLPVPTPKKKLPMNRWSPPAHDARGIERQWYECVWRSHAACCGCGDFINHLNDLAARFGRPVGTRPPTTPQPAVPQPPVLRPMPALPAPEAWPGDGADGGAGGDAAGGRGGGDAGAGDVADEDLLDAVDFAE